MQKKGNLIGYYYEILSSLTMIIGVSLSTITSVNAYNYNKNAFENTDELKIIAQFKKIVALSNLIQRIYHNDIRNMLP